jgi:hypothetical protein
VLAEGFLMPLSKAMYLSEILLQAIGKDIGVLASQRWNDTDIK